MHTMKSAHDIPLYTIVLSYSMLVIPLFFFHLMKLKLHKELFVSFFRMTIQLGLLGLYLAFIFKLDNYYLNVAYALFMILVANYSVVKNSGLKLSFFFILLPAVLISFSAIIFFFMFFVYNRGNLFAARYFIPISGMVLGNSMRRMIITIERFYDSIESDNDAFSSYIVMGGKIKEAIIPYLKKAYKASLMPALASYATMGLVSIPGMMTGQILGGTSPEIAVKYQITVLFAIFASTELASILSVIFSLKGAFDEFSMLKKDIFVRKKKKRKK